MEQGEPLGLKCDRRDQRTLISTTAASGTNHAIHFRREGHALPADAAKPYYTGEGSWGRNQPWPTPPLMPAFAPRWWAVLLLSHVDRGYWDTWDEWQGNGTGDPHRFLLRRWNARPLTQIGGFYCNGDIAYMQTVDWLSGARHLPG